MISEFFSILKSSTNSFDGQERHEKVVMLLRRHIFTILAPLILFFLVALIPIIIGVLAKERIVDAGISDLYLFLSSVWYLGLWISVFHSLTIYTLNTVIITDHRIVESDQHGFFNRQVSELHSHRIQDVSIHTNGVIETMLGYGNITVQTAGSEKQFVFHQIPHPDKVKDVIMQITSSRDSGVKSI